MKWAREVLPRLMDEYILAGKVRLDYRYIVFQPESLWAAAASECAKDQGQFWPYHHLLAQEQTPLKHPTLDKELLKRMAEKVDVDTAAFNACVDSDKYESMVVAESEAAEQQGIVSTPTFFIDGEMIRGAQPYEVFKEAIDRALSR